MSLLDLVDAHQPLLRPTGGCHNCKRKRHNFVPSLLTKGDIIFLGEFPEEADIANGELFSGSVGALLSRYIGEANLPGPLSFTSTVHCRPNTGAPVPKDIECCLSQFVLDEIRDYSLVVVCGSMPLKALFPGGVIRGNKFRGNIVHHPDFPGQRFYPIYHPGYILHRPELGSIFEQQMMRLGRIARGEPPRPWKLLQGSIPELWEALDAALASPLISIDWETNSLESWLPRAETRSVALTADAKTVVTVAADEPHYVAFMDKVVQYLKNPAKGVVGSNIGFDWDWAEREWDFAVRCTVVHDLGIMWNQVAQYTQPSLKELVSRELDGYRYLIHAPHKERDPVLLSLYGAEDVVYSLQLFWKAMERLQPKTLDLVTRVLGPTIPVLRQITTHGFYVREDYRQEQITAYKDKRAEAVEAWHAEDPEFIPTKYESGNGLKHYLFTLKQLPAERETSTGEEGTDAMSIKLWIKNQGADYLRHLLVIKECDKILSTYLAGYDKHLGLDSRVHSSYVLTRVPTGRSASSKPNVQNIPRVKHIRDLFGVPAGMRLLEADFSQIEFRIMVCLANDETGLIAYQRGDDAHTTTARQFAKDPDNQTKEERSRAKPINFSLIYGGNAYNVQRSAFNDFGLSWTEEECQGFVDGFYQTYRGFLPFHEESRRKLIDNAGWFESVLGHIAYFKGWDSRDKKTQDHIFRSALNGEAQGPAAQMCFAFMVYARRLLDQHGFRRVRFVNTIHDSVLLEIPDPTTILDIIALLEQARTYVAAWVQRWFMVPVVVDYSIGETWGSLEEVDLTK